MGEPFPKSIRNLKLATSATVRSGGAYAGFDIRLGEIAGLRKRSPHASSGREETCFDIPFPTIETLPPPLHIRCDTTESWVLAYRRPTARYNNVPVLGGAGILITYLLARILRLTSLLSSHNRLMTVLNRWQVLKGPEP